MRALALALAFTIVVANAKTHSPGDKKYVLPLEAVAAGRQSDDAKAAVSEGADAPKESVPASGAPTPRILLGLVGRFAVKGDPDLKDSYSEEQKVLDQQFEGFHGKTGQVSGICGPQMPWSASMTYGNLKEFIISPLERKGYKVDVALNAQTIPDSILADVQRTLSPVVSHMDDYSDEETNKNQWRRRASLLNSIPDINAYESVIITRPELQFETPIDHWNVEDDSIMYPFNEKDGSSRCDMIHIIPRKLVPSFVEMLEEARTKGEAERGDLFMWGQTNLIQGLEAKGVKTKAIESGQYSCSVSEECHGKESMNPLYKMADRKKAAAAMVLQQAEPHQDSARLIE